AGSASLKRTYGYNVRSWLTSIESPSFKEKLYYNTSYKNNKPLYGGNITAQSWQVAGEEERTYTYTYDPLSRLTGATYDASVTGRYNTSYSYDKHGNLRTLRRHGRTSGSAPTDAVLNDFTMTYTGNQLARILDMGVEGKTESGKETEDMCDELLQTSYNLLNLPRRVDVKNAGAEARVEYTYSAQGEKLRVKRMWNPDHTALSDIGSGVDEKKLTKSKVTDYTGNKVYEDSQLKSVLVEGGYYDVKEKKYYFYERDHQGNNRVVLDESGKIVQTNDYYPFGKLFSESTGKEKQPYKYNGKELDSDFGLSLYDYHARQYDPTVGSFTSMDPLAEKYYSISPYVYTFNNPVRFIDPDGKDGRDIVVGFLMGVTTNIIPNSSSLRDRYTPRSSLDYNRTLKSVDNATMAAGAAMIGGGGIMGTGGSSMVGAGVTIAATGVGAPEGTAIAGTGVAVIGVAEASIAGGIYLMGNTANNASDGYERGKKDTRTANDPLRVDSHGNKIPDPEAAGKAHTQMGTRKGRKGEYKVYREFDESGNLIRDIHKTNHGRKDHTNPHQHIYKDNPTGGSRQWGDPEPLK
ncbi:MAG: RHS repeat-associated core domain-containing protein, partial [Tannerellaceae bacterium]|nr:RHS repeat-associated core domain-containing protein [Tannerellaceae bacterium]